MAVTSIWKVEGRLARVLGYAGNPDKAEGSPDEWELQGVGAAILYAADPGKTERQLYVTGVNCLPATALEEMNATKRQYGKTGGIVAFHGYQAFAPGETDPATAHEVGVALAQELWGGRFEVVVATHLDKAHLHNHFVVNSVSFADGRRFHRDAACYRAMREASDELCREHGLSVVESPGRGGARHHAEWRAEREGRPVSPLSPATPFGEYVERYIALRSNGAIGRQTLANERRYAEYLREVIGLIPLRDLTAMDVERCLLQVPEISRRWANERVEEWKRKREQAVREGNRRKKKPLGSPRVAGPDMQHKILKFCREILNDALDRELVQKNVAKARFLSKNFKKSRPLIDPLMEEDAARFLHEVKALPLSPFKVACLALFSSGMRPEEALALKMGGVNVGGVPSARITGSLEHGTAEIVEYTKSDSSYRTVPIDDYTSREIGRWIEEKSRRLRAMGIRPGPSTPLVGELDKPLTYNVLKKQWQRFVEKVGFEGVRPYALRHTFATINLARGENIKTISVILGHASPSYTLDLYVGYIPSTSRELSNRYVSRLESLPQAA